MSQSTKRGANEAFGEDTVNGNSGQRQKKKQRSSRPKSKKPRHRTEGVPSTKQDRVSSPVAQNDTSSQFDTLSEIQKEPADSRPDQNRTVDVIQTAGSEDQQKLNTIGKLDTPNLSLRKKERHQRHHRQKNGKAENEGSISMLGSSGFAVQRQSVSTHDSQPPKQVDTKSQDQSPVSQKDVATYDSISPADRKKQKQVKKQKKKEARAQKHGRSHSGKKNEQHVAKPFKKRELAKEKTGHDWTLSSPSGGIFIDHDPVLTPDEQFLILATDKSIHIYATKTSLLVRTLHISRKSAIVSYAQTPGQDQFLIVGLEDGNLFKYDWTSGRRVWQFKLDRSLKNVTPTSSGPEGDSLLVVHSSGSTRSALTSLTLSSSGHETGRKVMLANKDLKAGVRFSAQLGVVVVCTNDSAFIGQLHQKDESGESLQWHQVSIAADITCFDAQILPPVATVFQSKKRAVFATVHLALGLKSGEIQMCNDVLNKTANAQGPSSQNVHTHRLYWHRAAPRSVKFSPDSNYLVSGGDETVLVIWQLDTNQKQVLPHLTTPILNLSISHQGSAYALRLADNSVMVLSTADLQPFANVNGLAFDVSSRSETQPVVLHPSHLGRLLLPYSSQALNPDKKTSHKPLTMLQTYDLTGQIQLHRQALARNLVSTINVAPNGQSLQEPDITHLDISHDGKWLVTVDQWAPHDKDLDEMYLSRGDQSSRSRINECYLRIWASISSDADGWELNTRIDEAASGNEWSGNERQILAIAISPARHQLAVADSNRHLKMYSPKARMRSGVPITDQNGQQLFTWTCDYESPIAETAQSSKAQHATLAFSEDGSVLAASWATNKDNKARVHLIQPSSGTVAATLPDIVTAGKSSLVFYQQYLIGLSRRLCIFDIVTMQQAFDLKIDNKFEQKQSKMAVDVRNGIVAVVTCQKDGFSQLVLFDVKSEERKPLYEGKIAAQVRILLADKAHGGFVIVDGKGQTMKVSGPGSGSVALSGSDNTVEPIVVRSSLENVFGASRKELTAAAAPALRDTAEEQQQKTLEDIFRFESTAQAPATKDLFNQVAQIVASVSA
ncbi:NET1-associated nuclear protein 1 [Neophaeococcomyces mojaviensis]|uniref:NET1-associated nuclear protein 1 n=1 Tax=Neophaeococcomyces mojaviensis TaxID=3383035 RepID=A0ACC3ABP6_9EURO|nr:NET1-associated nuclear protein 1 [Knufia sp. JES_112]